jgi:steroid delta-isomerase-like uncharacterized protein
METKLDEDRMKSRLALVEEHIRRENAHDLDGILDTFGPDARYDDEPWDDHRIGRDAVHLYYKELLAAAADFQIDIQHRYAASEAVILELMISGTHTGDWRGLPATGKKASFPLCVIFTFDSATGFWARRSIMTGRAFFGSSAYSGSLQRPLAAC